MNLDTIERLVRRLEASAITEFEFSDDQQHLILRLDPTTAGAPIEPAGAPTVQARAIGRLRLAHPGGTDIPDTPRPVAEGEIVAFLQAGPGLRPVVAEQAGTIGSPLQPEGALVGYGTPIFPYL